MSQLSRILDAVMDDASIPDDMREAIARLGRSERLFAAAGPLGKTKTPSRMKTEILLGRVSDILRRSDVEDGELLIRELEMRLRPQAVPGWRVITSPKTLVDERNGSSRLCDFLSLDTSGASMDLTTSNMVPFEFHCERLRFSFAEVATPRIEDLRSAHLAVFVNGQERARFPFADAVGWGALPFVSLFERNRNYMLELHHSDSISRARLHGTRVVAMFEGVAL